MGQKVVLHPTGYTTVFQHTHLLKSKAPRSRCQSTAPVGSGKPQKQKIAGRVGRLLRCSVLTGCMYCLRASLYHLQTVYRRIEIETVIGKSGACSGTGECRPFGSATRPCFVRWFSSRRSADQDSSINTHGSEVGNTTR